MPWTGSAYLAWFEGFYATSEAARLVRAVAARHDVSGLADDLHQSWYLSIRGTVDRLEQSGGRLPDWLDHEDAAVRYAVRALHNDATDLTRVQRRSLSRIIDLDDQRGAPIQLLDRATGPEADAGSTVALDAIRGELLRRFSSGELGCPQCNNDRVFALALAVVERLTGEVAPGASGRGVSGGTNDWDKVVYDALASIDPVRYEPIGGRMTPRARQMKVRCGGRVRDVLQELFVLHFPGVADHESTSERV